MNGLFLSSIGRQTKFQFIQANSENNGVTLSGQFLTDEISMRVVKSQWACEICYWQLIAPASLVNIHYTFSRLSLPFIEKMNPYLS